MPWRRLTLCRQVSEEHRADERTRTADLAGVWWNRIRRGGATSCGHVPAVNAHEFSAWMIPARAAEGPQVPRLIALVEPSAWPRWSLARTPKYRSPVDTLMTVSKPFRGANPTDFSSSGAGPASTSQVATSVAPF